MIYLQQYAIKKGLGDFNLNLVAQAHTENGAWAESRTGDQGCSIGLTQINLCARPYMKKDQRIKDWRFQIEYFIDEIKNNYDKYKNIDRAQVAWNNPRAAYLGSYKINYYYKIQKMKKLFTLTKI